MNKAMDSFVCAVIVAAGGSTRMGGKTSKQLLPLCEKPAIAYTLEAFEQARFIHELVVVCRERDRQVLEEICRQYQITKKKTLVEGGNTRQQSVLQGVGAASPNVTHFAIHDGARVLIKSEEIDRAVEDGTRWRASTLAVPVKDTIKTADAHGFVIATPDRSSLWSIQTPQVFEKELYVKAARQAVLEGADYTDDCQLVEHVGIRVHLCMGSYENRKLTTVDDLAVAEQIIRKREDKTK